MASAETAVRLSTSSRTGGSGSWGASVGSGSGVCVGVASTGSWVGSVPWPEITAYTVSKAGLEMLAKQMARELGVYGIRVNVVAPGIVKAGMAGELLKTDPVYAKRAGKVVPLGEFQTANQVADVVGFLCSSAGDYITGTVLLADGGCSLFQFDSDINTK